MANAYVGPSIISRIFSSTPLLVTRMTTSLSKLRDEGRNGDRGTLRVQGVESISDLTSNYRFFLTVTNLLAIKQRTKLIIVSTVRTFNK